MRTSTFLIFVLSLYLSAQGQLASDYNPDPECPCLCVPLFLNATIKKPCCGPSPICTVRQCPFRTPSYEQCRPGLALTKHNSTTGSSPKNEITEIEENAPKAVGARPDLPESLAEILRTAIDEMAVLLRPRPDFTGTPAKTSKRGKLPKKVFRKLALASMGTLEYIYTTLRSLIKKAHTFR